MGENGAARVLEKEDATMMDVGDGSRPPGDPPDGGSLWVHRVKGFMTGGRPTPEALMGDDFVAERLQVEFPDGVDGEAVVTIAPEVMAVMNSLWKQCLIVRVLGRKVTIPVLNKKLRELWKPKGDMSVIDLPRQFFMIRFEKEEEFYTALTGGPWRMFGSHLLVKRWFSGFNPMRDEITTTPVWVRLSNIPVNFYHKAILHGIAQGVGTPVRVDMTTLHLERARFARVCVEVDLTKPLKGSVVVNGDRYFVAYEGLANICSGCGIYGHLVHNCPKRVVEAVEENGLESGNRRAQGSTPEAEQGGDGYTVVRRRGPRAQTRRSQVAPVVGESSANQDRNLREISGHANMDNIVDTNRFANLENITESTDLHVVVASGEENKENEDSEIQREKGKSVAQGTNIGSLRTGRMGATGPRNGPIVKRFGGNKAAGGRNGEVSGPKGRQSKSNRPTGGLIFGPFRQEASLSTSGKRLRADDGSVAWPDGNVARAHDDNREGNRVTESTRKGVEQTQQNQLVISEPRESAVQINSIEMEKNRVEDSTQSETRQQSTSLEMEMSQVDDLEQRALMEQSNPPELIRSSADDLLAKVVA